MSDIFEQTAQLIKNSHHTIALTGAGISVASGIPDFRGEDGLWQKYNPEQYATIRAFREMPERVWKMFFEVGLLINEAEPNRAHYALSGLEKLGMLDCIITQNVDHLHEKAGSSCVIPFHGTIERLQCLSCNTAFERKSIMTDDLTVPVCPDCHAVLKPDVVLFGEEIRRDLLDRVWEHVERTEVLLVVATSASVYPADMIPDLCKENGATVIEFNINETGLTGQVTDIFIAGSVARTLPDLLHELKK